MKKRIGYALILTTLLFGGVALSQNTAVTWSTFDMGYAASIPANNVVVKSLVGQMLTGTSVQSSTSVTSGFLANRLFRTLGVENDGTPDIPQVYALRQNYPNPFNPTTTISFDLPKSSEVSLKIFNLLGKEQAVLLNKKMEVGSHKVKFDASGLPSGVYFYRIVAGDFVSTKKFLLLK